MSIAVLSEVYKETRRLAIAGSGLAADDFRLKKWIEPLEAAGEKAPVFGKVAQAIHALVQSDTQSSAQALLELSSLVTAILYTQGQTDLEGEFQSIPPSGLAVPTLKSGVRELKPLINALTTTGAGRFEIIAMAHARGAFHDLRLIKPSLIAIDDVNAEIGNFVADKILPLYGPAILPELRQTFDPAGKKAGQIRRLRLLYRLAPEATQDLIEQALESGSKEVKIAAIECVKDSKGHLGYMLEQTRSKLKDVRRAALNAIARFTESDAVDSLIKGLSGADVEFAASAASQNRSPKLLQFLLSELRSQRDKLLNGENKKQLANVYSRFLQLLGGLESRTDQESIDFLLETFQLRQSLEKLSSREIDIEPCIRQIASCIIESNDHAAQQTLVDARESLSGDAFGLSLAAAIRIFPPQQVFDIYSPYYMANPEHKRGRNLELERAESIRDALHVIKSGNRLLAWLSGSDGYDSRLKLGQRTKDRPLDRRWIDAAIQKDDLSTVVLVAEVGHQKSDDYMAQTMDRLLARPGQDAHGSVEILQAMTRVQHPDVDTYVLNTLKYLNEGKPIQYDIAWCILRLLPKLPHHFIAKLESLLPELDERFAESIRIDVKNISSSQGDASA